MQLTERAKQLIPKARIVSFATWKTLHSEKVIAIFQQADDEGRYLTDSDLEQIKTLSANTLSFVETARLLRDNAAKIVAEAREQVLAQYPNITQPGGDLYPPERAEACWRDFWHFLRCITYGIAGQSTQFTSKEGLNYMQQLYEELKVPLDAMVLGLKQLKIFSLNRFDTQFKEDLSPYFDHLISELNNFRLT
ncbi:MAG: phycobilisome protein [Moorea sp. SIO2B7]|nr:phycobilisome protein [Moorena sp. SIO2B7]